MKSLPVKQRVLAVVVFVLAGILAYLAFDRRPTLASVAEEAIECVRQRDGACINRLRYSKEKISNPSSDAQVSEFLAKYVAPQFPSDLGTHGMEINGGEYTAIYRLPNGVIALSVAETPEGIKLTHPLSELCLVTALAEAHRTDPQVTKPAAWIRIFQRDATKLEGYGIRGVEYGPDLGFSTWSEFVAKMQHPPRP